MLSPFFALTLPTVNRSVNTVSLLDGIKLLRCGFIVYEWISLGYNYCAYDVWGVNDEQSS